MTSLKAEFWRQMWLYKRYSFSYFSDFILLIMMFIAIFLGGTLVGGGVIGTSLNALVIGYILWTLIQNTISQMGMTMTNQMQNGIFRIYLYYAFRLGVIHSYRRPDPAKLHWIFKDELAYLDRLSEEVRLMGREKISTDVELLAYKHKLEDRIQTFTDERSDLRKDSRRKIMYGQLPPF